MLFQQGRLGLSGERVVADELQVFRRAIQVCYGQMLLIGAPPDIGEVLIRGFSRTQEGGFSGAQVVNTNGDVMAGVAGHGIADLVERARSGTDVLQEIR